MYKHPAAIHEPQHPTRMSKEERKKEGRREGGLLVLASIQSLMELMELMAKAKEKETNGFLFMDT